jgi:DNA polymerase III psi subunit
VDVERSVTALAALVAPEVIGRPALPVSQQTQTSATTAPIATPGGAPSTAAVIPQPSTGITAPTQQSNDAAAPASDQATRLVAPAQDASRTKSLLQQVLDALKNTRVESHKVHKYLPDFLEKLREELCDELWGPRAEKPQTHTAGQSESPTTTVSSAVLAYQAVSLTSVSLSIRTWGRKRQPLGWR